MSVRNDALSQRRAFQLASLAADLALMSERLADQATAIADVALELTESSERAGAGHNGDGMIVGRGGRTHDE